MHKPQATLPPLRRLPVITYRVTLDVPLQLVIKVSNLLRNERTFALMSQRWRAIRHVSADPSQIGDIATSVPILTQLEHKMIS